MAALTREAILNGRPLRMETVETPELGGAIVIRELSGVERDEYEYFVNVVAKNNWKNIRAKLVLMTACDPDGAPLFQSGDLDNLAARSGAGLDRLWKVATRLSAIGGDDVGELEKK